MNYVNPQLAKKWGIPPESLHRHYTDFFTDHPKNNDARCTIDNTLNSPSSSVYEIEIHNTLGEKYHIEVVKVPILDYEGKLIGVEGMARNITSRVSNIELFRGLLKSAPDVMIITDLNGTVLGECSGRKAVWILAMQVGKSPYLNTAAAGVTEKIPVPADESRTAQTLLYSHRDVVVYSQRHGCFDTG